MSDNFDGSRIPWMDIRPEDRPSFTRVEVSSAIEKLIREIEQEHPQWGPDRIAAHARLIKGVKEITPDHVRSVFIPKKQG